MKKDQLAELFSNREKQIVNDLARGLSAQEIASKLNLSLIR
ncbi:LuxR C-terminal-related transcriptional regulator (plasmid) [Tenacibaculum sp. ZS6-P6]